MRAAKNQATILVGTLAYSKIKICSSAILERAKWYKMQFFELLSSDNSHLSPYAKAFLEYHRMTSIFLLCLQRTKEKFVVHCIGWYQCVPGITISYRCHNNMQYGGCTKCPCMNRTLYQAYRHCTRILPIQGRYQDGERWTTMLKI